MKAMELIEKITDVGNERPLTLEEAADYLRLEKSTLYKFTYGKKIPHYKPNGKMLYFLKSDLREWMLKNRIKAISE